MRTLILLLTSLLVFSSGTVYADDAIKSVAREAGKGAFKEFERQIINEYFSDYVRQKEDNDEEDSYKSKKDKKKYKNKKSKKSKEKGLPPGIAKKLERGGTLPPGIAKRYIPDDLKRALPEPPYGYEHIIVGTDVMSVEIDTGKIADIITDVILGD
jgi:Ni/Co efflux regulator RcnB